MAESMPPTFEQVRQLNRSLTEQVLNRAESDPQWRQRLLDDSEAAMREANFPELDQLLQMHTPPAEGEVTGQHLFWKPGRYGVWECHFFTTKWEMRYYDY